MTAAIAELERCTELGLRAAMISGDPPVPYGDHAYDVFWQAASELKMPLALHVITGSTQESTNSSLGGRKLNNGEFYMSLIFEVQRTLTSIIWGGVLERFPELKIVSAENDVGWMPHFMYRMEPRLREIRDAGARTTADAAERIYQAAGVGDVPR